MLKNKSVDMIRFKSLSNILYVEPFLNNLREVFHENCDLHYSFIGQIKYWQSFGSSQYKHNFTYTDEYEHSYYFAYQHNSERRGNYYSFVIEYNPNKCKGDLLYSILSLFIFNNDTDYCKYTKVMSFDVAFDFDFNITNVCMDRGYKHSYRTFCNGGDDITYYIGKGDGRLKIYNKKKELLKQGHYIDGELTRYEVSLDVDLPLNELNKYCVECSLVEMYYLNFDLLVDVEDKLLLLGLLQAPELLNSLSRRKKEKMKKILSQYDSFIPTSDDIKNILINYIKSLKEVLTTI